LSAALAQQNQRRPSESGAASHRFDIPVLVWRYEQVQASPGTWLHVQTEPPRV
jgi:hypothetical protein